jgi:hypothetical protein
VIETYQVLLYPGMYTGIMGMGLLGVLKKSLGFLPVYRG